MSWVATAGLTLAVYTGEEKSDANNEVSDRNYTSAVEANVDTNKQLNEQTRQQEEKDADSDLNARIKALQAHSTLQAQGRNVSGTSIDRQHDAIQSSLGKFLADSSSNIESSRRQLAMSKKGATAQGQSRINSKPRTTYNPTMDIVNAGLSIYAGFNSAKSSATKSDIKQPSFTDYAMGDWK